MEKEDRQHLRSDPLTGSGCRPRQSRTASQAPPLSDTDICTSSSLVSQTLRTAMEARLARESVRPVPSTPATGSKSFSSIRKSPARRSGRSPGDVGTMPSSHPSRAATRKRLAVSYQLHRSSRVVAVVLIRTIRVPSSARRAGPAACIVRRTARDTAPLVPFWILCITLFLFPSFFFSLNSPSDVTCR